MKLKDYLKETGLTQEELADKIGISRRALNNIVNGRRAVGKKLAAKIEQTTDGKVTILELLYPDNI